MKIYVFCEGDQAVRTDVAPESLPELLERNDSVVWVDVDVRDHDSLARAESIYRDVFRFHHLTIEDCREARNQPKVEEFPEYLFFIVHGIKPQEKKSEFKTKELDIYLGPNFVVTNRNENFRSIDAVEQAIQKDPRAFEKGAAYLLHQIMDMMVDFYMPIVDEFDATIHSLEDRVYETDRGGKELLVEIMELRRSVARLKRISTRQLEVLHKIAHGDFPQIPENVKPFYRDVHDHLLRISDLAESYRDLVSGLFEIHSSVTANRTNEVMKLLALISATMLPLTLLTGIYGMNFENMPLLRMRYGSEIVLVIMLAIFISLIVYFKRKGWFGR